MEKARHQFLNICKLLLMNTATNYTQEQSLSEVTTVWVDNANGPPYIGLQFLNTAPINSGITNDASASIFTA
jgi:hypothetical protein